MAKSSLTRKTAAHFIERFAQLTADSKPRFGSMDSAKMVWHLSALPHRYAYV